MSDLASRPRAHAGRTILGFVAAVLALELASRGLVATRNHRFDQGPVVAAEVSSQPQPPLIVFLGSSHAQCAVVPAVIERRLRRPRGAVFNAGLAGAGPRERLRLYQAAEPTLGRARLAVVETSPIDFNLNSGREERQRRDLHARLTAPATPLGRADLLLGWAMASWDERHAWYDLAADHGHAVLAGAGIDRRPSLFDADGYARVGGRPASAEELARDVELAIHRHFQDYTFDDEAARDQARLVERIESHGTRVLLVDYPVIPAYRAVLEGRYEEAETRWRAALRASLPDRPLLRILPEPSEVIGDFRDADHLCRNGAIRLSDLIAEWSDVIRLRDPSVPAPTPDHGRVQTDPHYMIVTGSTSTDMLGQRTSP